MANKLRDEYNTAFNSWYTEKLEHSFSRFPQREEKFATTSGIPIKTLYGPDDLADEDEQLRLLGFPGEYPFTRGPQASMYRSKPWTMRQFAGFGTAEDTNARFRYLLNQGQIE